MLYIINNFPTKTKTASLQTYVGYTNLHELGHHYRLKYNIHEAKVWKNKQADFPGQTKTNMQTRLMWKVIAKCA